MGATAPQFEKLPTTKAKATAVRSAEAFLIQNPDKERIMANSTQVAPSRAITVPFHGADLFVVDHHGQPYTPMKPIVQAMGLDWGSQFRKVAANESRWGISVMGIPSAGGAQAATCILLRKLPAWLATIDAGRVKNLDARARVIQYQNERDVQKLRREKRELIATGTTREDVRAKEAQITAVMARLNEAAARRKATAPE